MLQKQINLSYLFNALFFSILIYLLQPSNQQAQDNYTSYYSGSATAMDILYSTNLIIFANQNYQIVQYNTIPTIAITTINTAHKAQISSLSISPDGNLVLSGGSDYTARVYNMNSKALLCTFDELRGDIISAKIGSDNNFIAFGSSQGYLYYGYISNCTKSIYIKLNYILRDLQIILARNQIWVADGDTSVFVLNYVTQGVTTITLPTQRVNSVFSISSTSTIGVCSQRAFYILNNAGIIQYTLPNPTLFTKKCRIASGWSGQPNTYFITAIPQATMYTISSTTYYPLWNIWKLDASTFATNLYLQQRNSATRYGGVSKVLDDAAAFLVNKQSILVASIATGYNPYYNYYRDLAAVACSSTYFANSGFCQKCSWDDTQRAFCTQCSSAGVCNECKTYAYLISGSHLCSVCPINCYTCTSNTVCTSCVGGYTLVSSQCIISNLTGCVNSYWYSNSASKCYQCAIGYFAQNGLACKSCDIVYANCSQCNSTGCTKCSPNFVMMSTASTNCQLCAYAIQGCAACLNQTYCDTCYQSYPYFSYPTVGARICHGVCLLTSACLTCQHNNYKNCATCDSNRTLLANKTCTCLPDYPIINATTQQCQACRDYISDCTNCTSSTFCNLCDGGFYFQDTNATHQSCQTCNYTCDSCNVTWYRCASCDPTAFRVIDSVSGRCVCQGISYFQMGTQISCQLCSDHINHCNVCYNQTFCITCDYGYYVKTTGAGTNICQICQSPCVQCYGTASNCTDCATGRQLNYSTHTCNCLTGYYATGPTTCAPCSPLLGSCLSCTNNSVCLQCWQNNYFVMVGSIKMCDLCQVTCLTCATWTKVCATCDSLAKRVLNPVTHQCDCMNGYTETNGRCLNCSAAFQYCTSCDSAVCFSCQPGYSLAFGGLKCTDCQSTYPGCTQCLNGVCAACNQSAGYELSYSMCICSPGYYFKELQCLPYAMGNAVQRLFQGYATYSQDMNTSLITIQIYFRCQGIKFPYGLTNSVKLSINDELITTYQVQKKNTTLTFTFMPLSDSPQAIIKIQFLNKTVYDLQQYGPRQKVYQFTKNIFLQAKYELSDTFSAAFIKYIIPSLQWVCTLLLLLGQAQIPLMFMFTVHIIPAFVLLDLSPPMPLLNMLSNMAKINSKSLFAFAKIDAGYEDYGQNPKYLTTYGLTGGLVYKKVTDLVLLAFVIVFYGIICPQLTRFIPEGKFKKVWYQKFQQKKYSTLSNCLLLMLPSFLFCCMFDYRMVQFNPSSFTTIAISFIILVFSCIFVFSHSSTLHYTQFNDNYKNQDSFCGASILQPKSITYIMSLLIVGLCTIPMFGFLKGIYCLPILMVIVLWHISHYRFWDNFPNKIIYFVKLFYALIFLFLLACFLIFEISQKYSSIDIKTIELLGLISLVTIIILISLSYAECLFMILYTLYKICKQNQNLVDNLQAEHPQLQQEQGSQKYSSKSKTNNMRATLADRQKQQEQFNPKLTNKQEHMKKFREQHFKTTMGQMYNKIKTSQNFNSTGMSKRKI